MSRLNKHIWQTLFAFFLLAILLPACHDVENKFTYPQAADYDNEVFLKWNDLFLELDRYAKGYRPGPAPRALGYLGLAAYEASVPGMSQFNSLQNEFGGLSLPAVEADKEYHWPTCVNESYYYLMQRFFYHMDGEPDKTYANIAATHQYLASRYASETDKEVYERSAAFGQAVAKAVYDWSVTDAVGHNAFLTPQPTTYTPPSGPGLWQPTFPDYGRAVFPYWGQVRTFALNENEKLARPPLNYSEDPQSPFYQQAMEVFTTVEKVNNPLTQEEKAWAYRQHWIAFFWSDDVLNLTFSPPARLVAIANQVVRDEKINLAECAELYAKMGLALSDCSVAVWHSKYVYNVERPVSYIRRVIANNYPAAADWQTLLVNTNTGQEGITPAFPAYPSGHSGFAGAGTEVLSSMFEYTDRHPGTYHFTDYCHQFRTEFPGTPRVFASFNELGVEDAMSRIPLGVHFRMDCDEGLRLGRLAAQRVLELPWKK